MKRVIESRVLPPIGPYSPGIAVSADCELIFFSGVIPTLSYEPTTFREEVESVFENLEALLGGTGMTLADVVDVQAFVVDLPKNGPTFNEVYGERMPKPYPARATIGVATLPMHMHVELKVTAVRRTGMAGDGSQAAGETRCHNHGCG